MEVYLVDGTYELFRHYFALPSKKDADGHEVAAVRGVVASMLNMIRGGATHLAVATDHVVESFRNKLWSGYKTGDGVEPDLLAQFPILEEALSAAGIVVWPMVEFEADDALAAGAVSAAMQPSVKRIFICTPDKDLAQSVRGSRIVQLNRRTGIECNEDGVFMKFGVLPSSIPDFLALVGDSADGYPGLAGWGSKSTSAVLAKYAHIEAIPKDCADWRVRVPNALALSTTLYRDKELALLFRELATLRTDIELFDDDDQLRWTGVDGAFDAIARRLDGIPNLSADSSRQRRTLTSMIPQMK